MNHSHDPGLRSWLESANDPSTDFPIQNLPFGVFDDGRGRRVGIAIGDSVLDVSACARANLIEDSDAVRACRRPTLNALMAADATELMGLRSSVSSLLAADGTGGEAARKSREAILAPIANVTMCLPADIGDYTDFYASVHHATNVGSMFRPENPLLPNYKYVPIGYHGRASSIVASGTPVRRPSGQTRAVDAAEPSFGPSKMLDYESELGFFVGKGNRLGDAIPIDRAADHIFGYCLVNDWSARDIQAWEYQPLGPFLAKNFATTVSPWVVTAEAAEPYCVPAAGRADGDPAPMPYLSSPRDAARGGLGATLEVYILSARMRERGGAPFRLSRAPFSLMYWTPGQMLAHHASNGCNLRSGDLLASGTVSGDTPDSRGSMLELTWRGAEPLTLPTGEERKFLADGDEVIMKGSLHADGHPRLGFGECRGTILPSTAPEDEAREEK